MSLDAAVETGYLPSLLDNNTACAATSAVTPASIQIALSTILAYVAVVVLGTLVPHGSFGALSLRRSWDELLQNRHSRLNVLDVFRVVAIVWVMLNHIGGHSRIDSLERLPSANAFKKAVHDHPIFGPLLGNSALGVEIFLVLSGLLAARSWLRKANEPFFKHYASFLTRRVFRIFPTAAAFIWLASGPVFEWLLPRYHVAMISSCGMKGIVSHLTFTGNWQANPTCMGYLWYLGLDMQLYLAAPFLLHLVYKQPRFAMAVVVAVTTLSAGFRAYYCTTYGFCNNSDVDIPFISFPGQDASSLSKIYAGVWETYARPYTKCGPFLLGILLGYATTMPKLVVLSPAVARALFVGGLGVAVGTVFAILPEYWHPDAGTTAYNLVYTAWFRTVFASAICFMIAALFYQKPDVEVSSWWSVLARLTFNAYLLHMPAVYCLNYLPYMQTATGAIEMLVVLPAVAVASFASALLFFLFIESPLSSISSQWLSKTGL